MPIEDINFDAVKDFLRMEAPLHIASAVEGMSEQAESLKKISSVSFGILGCSLAAGIVGVVITVTAAGSVASAIGFVIIGASTVSSIVFAVHAYYTRQKLEEAKAWLKGYTLLAEGKTAEATDVLKGFLKEEYRAGIPASENLNPYHYFKDQFYQNFSVWVPYCQRQENDQGKALAPLIFSDALIYHACRKVQAEEIDEESFAALKKDLEMAELVYASLQETMENILPMFQLFSECSLDEVRGLLRDRRIRPASGISVGHSMLLEIIRSFRGLEDPVAFNEQGFFLKRQYAKLNDLEAWKTSLQKAKKWIESSHEEEGSPAVAVIDRMLSTNTVQELFRAARAVGNPDYWRIIDLVLIEE